ncbi:MAG: PhnD/SsuA/transferrin family substrate-binding protein [Pseudomonadota bacterium]
MIAFLGMYDMPALQSSNDLLWSLIRAELGFGPKRLTREGDPWEIWRDPGLLLAQTCGMPFRTHLHSHVQLVGTPDYGVPGCREGHYCSVLVARAADQCAGLTDFHGAPFAYNDPLSQSGWSAFRTHLDTLGIEPGPGLCTGAHVASMNAVIDGRANWASIDAVTWSILQDLGQAEGLREIDRTDPTPGLPLITSLSQDPETIATAVRAAIAALPETDASALRIKDLIQISEGDYLAVPTPLDP